MPFRFFPQADLPEVVLVEPRVFGDERGWFMETYKESEFEAAGIRGAFRQDNHARSTQQGVIRGLHFQLRAHAQGKLVRCTEGAIFDVAVDIRRGSPTYKRWVAAELSAENKRILWVPEGFAHGYCTLTPTSEVVYRTTGEYAPTADRAVRWDDPTIGIAWPTRAPILSPKDQAAPFLADSDNDLTWEGSARASS